MLGYFQFDLLELVSNDSESSGSFNNIQRSTINNGISEL